MVNLQKELDKIFSFERNECPVYRRHLDETKSIVGQPWTNIEVARHDLGISGIAMHLHEDNQGVVIYEYVVDKEVRSAGPFLTTPLDMLQDCERHYYGLKLNVLAYLTGKRVKSLVIQNMYTNESFPVRVNQTAVKIFLSHICGRDVEPKAKPAEQKQFALFAA